MNDIDWMQNSDGFPILGWDCPSFDLQLEEDRADIEGSIFWQFAFLQEQTSNIKKYYLKKYLKS